MTVSINVHYDVRAAGSVEVKDGDIVEILQSWDRKKPLGDYVWDWLSAKADDDIIDADLFAEINHRDNEKVVAAAKARLKEVEEGRPLPPKPIPGQLSIYDVPMSAS
jgi:hypothetical protein